MEYDEFKDLLELKREVEEILGDLEDEIILFPAEEQDSIFDEMLKKAIYYRNIILKIDEQLKDL